ncbi:MAG TPA: methionyl-tRNA formyltransferase [Burkholderiaceae bacterium]|nr:methionyl-tRNA formyltransferase [Burkholderiaceae bacterium]
MKIAFAGTPEFAAVALQRLLEAGHEVPLVLTQPDRPAGRGMKLQASAVKLLALDHGLQVAQPRSLRLDGKYPEDAQATQWLLRDAALDAMVVAAYGLILPQWVLDTPAKGCLNIHASLLPRWRGAAPIHRAIEAGDAETGVTIMQMDAGLDTGDMLLMETLPIAPDDSTARLHDKLAALGGRMIVDALAQLQQLKRTPQPTEGVTYAHKIEKHEALIDWTLPAEVLARRVRAFDPFPGALTHHGSDNLKVWAAEAEREAAEASPPGTVLEASAGGVRVATGQGVLRLTELQRAGGKRLPAAAFLQGADLQPGQRLGNSGPDHVS